MKTLYFTHDLNSRNNPKILALRVELGWEGVGVFWALIEILYERDNRCDWSKTKALAYELHTDPEYLTRIIKEFELFEYDDESFWSQGVAERIGKREETLDKKRKASNVRYKRQSETQQTTDREQKTTEPRQNNDRTETENDRTETENDRTETENDRTKTENDRTKTENDRTKTENDILSNSGTEIKEEKRREEKRREKCVDTHLRETDGVCVSPPIVSDPQKAIEASDVIALYHELCPDLPKVAAVSEPLRAKIASLTNQFDHDRERLSRMLQTAGRNKFLCGNGPKGWRATLEWLCDGGWQKLLNGNYDVVEGAAKPNAVGRVLQNTTDFKKF